VGELATEAAVASELLQPGLPKCRTEENLWRFLEQNFFYARCYSCCL